MVCTPVRGDNPRALASGLSHVQVDRHGMYNSWFVRVSTSSRTGGQT